MLNKNLNNQKTLDFITEIQELNDAYNKHVDKYHNQEVNIQNKFQEDTGYSLKAKVQEIYENSDLKNNFHKKVKVQPTFEKIAFAIQSYERKEKNTPSNDYEKDQWSREDYDPKISLTSRVNYTLNTLDDISEVLKRNEKRQKHIHEVKSVSDLKFGDVIEMYQPYEEEHLKKHTKNSIDSRGQNRYYGVVQPLPNGDVLAVSFYGHRTQSDDSLQLNYSDEYPYPASKAVSPSLDIGSKNLIQIPRNAIIKGNLLKEKQDAASFGKKYDKFQTKIKVLEISPENMNKFKKFKSMINKNELDIGWSKDKNEVIPASPAGKRMFNSEYHDRAKYLLAAGIYEKRNLMLNQRLERQQIIRDNKFGKKPIRIQSNYQKEFIKKERHENRKSNHDFER